STSNGRRCCSIWPSSDGPWQQSSGERAGSIRLRLRIVPPGPRPRSPSRRDGTPENAVMSPQTPRRILPVAIRVGADAVFVNMAVFAALSVRAYGVMRLSATVGDADPRDLVHEVGKIYAEAAPLLTVICLLVFGVTGFYTRGRFYTSRYKAVAITQAVSLSYLLFGFLTFFVPALRPHPRSSLILGWLVTAAALI